MSSDRRGSVGDATEPTSPAAWTDSGLSEGVGDDAQADDPWFTPGPKTAASEPRPAETSTDAAAGAADPGGHQTDWFLRTGRAGLHPDSVTSFDEASGEPPPDQHDVHVAAAGAPPWAGETTALSASTPPPWETGPWPGPDAQRSRASRRWANGETGTPGTRLAGTAATDGVALDGAAGLAAPGRWPPRTVVTAGLIPLVVPGLVLGVMSLRESGNQAIRKASWLAIGASVVWAVIIIVIAASFSGGSAGACSGYPAAVRQAYEKALTDLNGSAPPSAQAADLETAASLANASAASAGQIGVRNALFTMANDMAEARADVVAHRVIPAALRQHLAGDGVVPAGSCG